MTQSEISAAVAQAAKLAKESNPLTPSITNTVTINFVANAQLAVGGSAAMVYLPDEGVAMASVGAAMYINVGTLFPYIRRYPAPYGGGPSRRGKALGPRSCCHRHGKDAYGLAAEM